MYYIEAMASFCSLLVGLVPGLQNKEIVRSFEDYFTMYYSSSCLQPATQKVEKRKSKNACKNKGKQYLLANFVITYFLNKYFDYHQNIQNRIRLLSSF